MWPLFPRVVCCPDRHWTRLIFLYSLPPGDTRVSYKRRVSSNVSRKVVKYAYDKIFATHAFCTNHRQYWRIKRPYRPYNCNWKDTSFCVKWAFQIYCIITLQNLFMTNTLHYSKFSELTGSGRSLWVVRLQDRFSRLLPWFQCTSRRSDPVVLDPAAAKVVLASQSTWHLAWKKIRRDKQISHKLLWILFHLE